MCNSTFFLTFTVYREVYTGLSWGQWVGNFVYLIKKRQKYKRVNSFRAVLDKIWEKGNDKKTLYYLIVVLFNPKKIKRIRIRSTFYAIVWIIGTTILMQYNVFYEMILKKVNDYSQYITACIEITTIHTFNVVERFEIKVKAYILYTTIKLSLQVSASLINA